jgi:hypothetical protein
MAALARCLATDGRLHLLRLTGHSHQVNEAESGSLSLRLTDSPHEASSTGITPRQCSFGYLVERAISSVSSFHLTR